VVFGTPLDLVSALASSQAAREAERDGFISTLSALHASLASVLSAPPGGASSLAQFSNAASDFFCLVKLLLSSPS
jgi:hypothetical protein